MDQDQQRDHAEEEYNRREMEREGREELEAEELERHQTYQARLHRARELALEQHRQDYPDCGACAMGYHDLEPEPGSIAPTATERTGVYLGERRDV